MQFKKVYIAAFYEMEQTCPAKLQGNTRVAKQIVATAVKHEGQKDTVVIQHIITKGTIDEDVMRVLKRKEKTQSGLIEAVKANL